MRLAINLCLSFAMLGLCLWLVWPDGVTRHEVEMALRDLQWADFAPYLFVYLGLQIAMHVCRSVRWNNLLAPLGVKVPLGPLLAISSVGFMAILALPARLGEFVRPGLLRKRGVSASAALGTVAVERVVDGLLVSVFVFGAFFALDGPRAPGWMMPTAYGALGVFAAALVFLVFALRRPEATVRFCLRISLLPRFAPRIASRIELKLLDMIRGLVVLKDVRNMLGFLAWSIVYWALNGLAMWVLARAFGLELSVLGGFATMGLVAVGITLPNSPGLVGQYQWFTLLGISLYLGADARTEHTELYKHTFAFANVQYLLQVIWYFGTGALALATPWVSIRDLRSVRSAPPADDGKKLAMPTLGGDDTVDAADPG
ncbi:MAG: hypothetical protein H6Q90_3851 [Deltaproteobacteria bacterium]|nr:hypothetical protein [Deltaproteobacteria bacterium]